MLTGSVYILMGGRFTCTPDWRSNGYEAIPSCKIYYPVQGSAWLKTETQHITLRPNRAYLIPPNLPVAHGCVRRMILEWMHFEPDDPTLARACQQLNRIHTWPARPASFWSDILMKTSDTLARPSPASVANLCSAAMYLMGSALENEHATYVPPERQRLLNRLEPAIQYMNDHSAANPPLTAIARAANLSPGYFHRLFHQATGQTPFAYMLRQRMNKAMRLLHTTPMSIAEIGRACGYESPFYFSRTFKQYFHLSPRQARQTGGRP